MNDKFLHIRSEGNYYIVPHYNYVIQDKGGLIITIRDILENIKHQTFYEDI